jgi:hypothetical protein
LPFCSSYLPLGVPNWAVSTAIKVSPNLTLSCKVAQEALPPTLSLVVAQEASPPRSPRAAQEAPPVEKVAGIMPYQVLITRECPLSLHLLYPEYLVPRVLALASAR